MLQYRMDDDQGGPQPKPPGGWKQGDKNPEPQKPEDDQKEAPAKQ